MEQHIKVAVDAIVFGYSKNSLYVLLVRQKAGPFSNAWCLPGGFVLDQETLTDAVRRELVEETGISVDFLEQLYTFGELDRDPRERVISVAYFGLADPSKLSLMTKNDTDADAAAWFEIKLLPKMGYDHAEIINLALQRLKSKLSYQPIGFDLLPEKFLFSDLENLYTTILEREIDRRNFRKKIMSFGLVEELDEIQTSGAGRPGKLFRFNKAQYESFSIHNFMFEIKFA